MRRRHDMHRFMYPKVTEIRTSRSARPNVPSRRQSQRELVIASLVLRPKDAASKAGR